MPSTQAYTVSWTVTIQPEGDVSEDVAEITIIQEDGKPDSATVTLDTSERPHALEEQRQIDISVTDGNTTITFDGFTDSVSDDEENPIVTVDARESDGLLQDATAAGSIDAENLFRVIEAIISGSPGKVREVSFDAASLETSYSTFANSTKFASLSIAHIGEFDVNEDSVVQNETTSDGKEAELRIDTYFNTTSTTYVATVKGEDANGDTVEASFDLPPGSDVQDAYGTDSFKLALSGGNEKWVQVNSISTNVPDLTGSQELSMEGSVWNYIKTNWNFNLERLSSVDQAISRIVRYISGLDEANDWEYYVDDSDELIVQPSATGTPERYVFREGDNVLKPVASRNLDGVRNFIKVNGAGNVNVWAWAYGGDMRYVTLNPFENDIYPNNSGAVIIGSSPAPQNDIDQINLRAESLSSDTFTSFAQAIDIAKKALKQYLRTPVTGQAPVAGLHPAEVGDEAEVYYPSRGIPARVSSNIYTVEKVEYSITPEAATTTVDFGTSKPNLGDVIGSGGTLLRNDISNSIRQYSDRTSTTGPGDGGSGGGPGSDGGVVVGELKSQNDDGTWTVEGEDGNTYENVRVI